MNKGIQSKRLIILKNNDYSEDEILKENGNINESYDNDELKIKKYTSGLKIYIPECIIEDRIISREFISNNK